MEHQTSANQFGLGPAINISVRRNYLYEDSFEKLSPDNGDCSPHICSIFAIQQIRNFFTGNWQSIQDGRAVETLLEPSK